MPILGARYWAILCLASICGANLGDAFPDLFHMDMGIGLAILAGAFAVLVALQGVLGRTGEALFWIAILIVRSAATEAADISAKIGFLPAAAAWAVVLVIVAVLSARHEREQQGEASVPRPGPFYWLGMFSAGTLGTIAADGLGHAFGPLTIGYPLTAAGETLALIGVLVLRGRAGAAYWSYWLAVVVIRAWGTSVGDITKFLTSLPLSLAVSAALMALAVVVWRPAAVRTA
jgi:uncharacterized membrane-anchored protein